MRALDAGDGGRYLAQVEVDLDLGLPRVFRQHKHDLVHPQILDQAGRVQLQDTGLGLQGAGSVAETAGRLVPFDRCLFGPGDSLRILSLRGSLLDRVGFLKSIT